MRRISLGIITALILFFIPAAHAEIENIFVQATPTSGTIGESFQLSVVVKGGNGSEKLRLTGGENFTAQYRGPQSSVQIINGSMTTQVAYIFDLTPKSQGVFDSPGVEIESEGKLYSANGVKIRVGPEEKTPGGQGDAILLKQRVSSDHVYVGEQVVNELELYSTDTLYDAHLVDVPFDGFWSVETGPQEKSMKSLNGTEYLATKIKKSLYPLSAGRVIVPSREVRGKVRKKARRSHSPFGFDPFGDDLFGDFLGSTYRDFSVTAPPVTLTVKELPPLTIRSDLMLGRVVGNTSLSAELSSDPVDVGGSKTLTITVQSDGNLNPLDSLHLAFPDGVRSYEEVPDRNAKESAGFLQSQRVFRISLVFTKPGKVSLPPIRLGYFDPLSEEYKIAAAELPLIEVRPTGAEGELTTQPASPASTTGADPSPYPTDRITEEAPTPLPVSTKLFAGLIAASFLALAIVAFSKYRAGAAVRRIRGLLTDCRDDVTLSALVRGYIEYACQSTARNSSIEELRHLVSQAQVGADLGFALQTILDDLEAYAFGTPTSRSEILERIKGRIEDRLSAHS